ncbi:MAG: nitrite reductase small subunit NirD [Aquihabitans sp.]
MTAVEPILDAPDALADLDNEWVRLCAFERLTPDRGMAALVDGDAVALFRLYNGDVHAVSNRDPFTRASVLSRGLVGDFGGVPTVASPLHKQRFDLRTGRCVEDPAMSVGVHGVRVVDGIIELRRMDAT